MDATIVASMRKEEAELLRKLTAVQAFLRAYGERPSEGSSHKVEGQPLSSGSPPSQILSKMRRESTSLRDKRSIHEFSPYGREAIATSMSFLMGQASPVRTRELVASLQGAGFVIRGENAINALGALLGRSADIISYGKAGWMLAEPASASHIVGEYAHKENEPSAGTLDGSDAAGEGASPPDPALIHSHRGL